MHRNILFISLVILASTACATNRPDSDSDTADTGEVIETVPEVVYTDSLMPISAGLDTSNLAFIGKFDDAKAQEYKVSTAPMVFVNGLITDFDDAAHLWCWDEFGATVIDRNPDLVMPQLNLYGFEIPASAMHRSLRCSLGGPNSLNTPDGWTYWDQVAVQDPALLSGNYVCPYSDGFHNFRFELTSLNSAEGPC